MNPGDKWVLNGSRALWSKIWKDGARNHKIKVNSEIIQVHANEAGMSVQNKDYN